MMAGARGGASLGMVEPADPFPSAGHRRLRCFRATGFRYTRMPTCSVLFRRRPLTETMTTPLEDFVSKRLVICCDGTWNTPDQVENGLPSMTNVAKVALTVSPGSDIEQRVFYQQGVGSGRWEHIRGGAFGYGLSRNVREAYRFIVDNYVPGDELFFFGFSRGAFTARSTVGFIRNAGILRRENIARIDEAYALYRDRLVHPNDVESRLFRRSYSFESTIKFVGVWDTVGALGIPLGGIKGFETLTKQWSFHDTNLSSTVESAYQALAIDERRRIFEPALWLPQEGAQSKEVQQVWFSGVHSDVGGGYEQTGLSDIALTWMVQRAARNGLEFSSDFTTPPRSIALSAGSSVPVQPCATGKLHDSWQGFYKLIKPFIRMIGRDDPATESVAQTAVDRLDDPACSYESVGLTQFHQHHGDRVVDVLNDDTDGGDLAAEAA